MKTLIIGAGPLGSLYAVRLHQAGHDITLLARNGHFNYLREQGVCLINAFTNERVEEHVPVVDHLIPSDEYDLAIVIMRKNSVRELLPLLGRCTNIRSILFMGNNAAGFSEYQRYVSVERMLFGFPGGGGARIDHVVHYIDTEKPNGKRMSVTIGEIDGVVRERTRQVRQLFESAKEFEVLKYQTMVSTPNLDGLNLNLVCEAGGVS